MIKILITNFWFSLLLLKWPFFLFLFFYNLVLQDFIRLHFETLQNHPRSRLFVDNEREIRERSVITQHLLSLLSFSLQWRLCNNNSSNLHGLPLSSLHPLHAIPSLNPNFCLEQFLPLLPKPLFTILPSIAASLWLTPQLLFHSPFLRLLLQYSRRSPKNLCRSGRDFTFL